MNTEQDLELVTVRISESLPAYNSKQAQCGVSASCKRNFSAV